MAEGFGFSREGPNALASGRLTRPLKLTSAMVRGTIERLGRSSSPRRPCAGRRRALATYGPAVRAHWMPLAALLDLLAYYRAARLRDAEIVSWDRLAGLDTEADELTAILVTLVKRRKTAKP